MAESKRRFECIDNVDSERGVGHTVGELVEFLSRCDSSQEIVWCPANKGHRLILIDGGTTAIYIAESAMED